MQVLGEAMQGQRARWLVQERIPAEIAGQLPGVGAMTAHLLYCRGLRTAAAIETFLRGTSIDHDPLALPDMTAAVERIARAVSSGETVAIYSDFDCDGLTAAAVLESVLRSLGLTPLVHIPEREHGHGLRPESLAALSSAGATLLITADCGVTSIDEVRVARGMGMDVIVTDHHEARPDGLLPSGLTISPTRHDSVYPYRALCGVGVIYKLVQALAARFPAAFDPADLLDLVALGTVADIVPLIDENRSLVIAGLERLHTTRRPGLLALCESAGLDPRSISAEDIGFRLAPRLNAANRMASPRTAYDLITARDETSARALVAHLNDYNQNRQSLVAHHTEQIIREVGDATALLEKIQTGEQAPLLFVTGSWPTGISGLLASSLVDNYGVPAFVGASAGEGIAMVSARGVPGVRIDTLLHACEDALPGGLFLGYGGHALAGGFQIDEHRLETARTLLEDHARDWLTVDTIGAVLSIDAELHFGRLTLPVAQQLRTLAPFGAGFTEPLFLARRVTVRRITPAKVKHARFSLSQEGIRMDGIQFKAPADTFSLQPGEILDIVFHLQVNEWNGNLKSQLCIRDWRPTP